MDSAPQKLIELGIRPSGQARGLLCSLGVANLGTLWTGVPSPEGFGTRSKASGNTQLG